MNNIFIFKDISFLIDKEHMDFLEEVIEQGVYVILFCIGITILIFNFNNYMSSMYQVKELEKEQIIYEGGDVSTYENNLNLVSKGELISYLLHQLEYDIEIDAVSISKTENVRGNIKNYEFHNDYYKKGYRYDEKGMITSIVFFGV